MICFTNVEVVTNCSINVKSGASKVEHEECYSKGVETARNGSVVKKKRTLRFQTMVDSNTAEQM